jgi:hypothetical protein
MCQRECVQYVAQFMVWRECMCNMCLKAPPRGHPAHSLHTRVVPQLTCTVLLNRGHIIMQSIIDIGMPRKRLGDGVE